MMKDARKLFYILSIMAAVLVTTSAVLFFIGTRVLRASEIVARDYEVIHTLENTVSVLADGETGSRGFIITGNDEFLAPYESCVTRIQANLAHLDEWVATGELPAEKIEPIKTLVRDKLSRLSTTNALNRADHNAAVERVKGGEGKRVMDRIRGAVGELITAQNVELKNSEALSRKLTMFRTGSYVVCIAVELCFLCWAAWRIKKEMDRVAAAAEAIREQRELYATTLASIGDAVITTDERGRITFMNQVAVDLTGWGANEVAGLPLSKVFRIINETSRLTVENPVDKVLRLGTIVGLANHTLLIRKDESEVPIDDSGAPIRHRDGSIRGVVLVFRDFSEHKKTEAAIRHNEERMRLATDGADLGMFYCTFPLDKITWNDRCKAHFFLPPEAEIDFDLFYSRLHPDDREPTRLAVDRAEKERVPYDIEYRVVAPEGQRWIRAVGRFFYDDNGKPVRFDGVTMDISDRKAKEQQIQEAKAAAESANRAKDQFLATLSHELRTPLTPVLATLGMWEKSGMAPPSFKDDVQMIRRNIELEARLIDDLLDLTRVVKGKLVVSPEKIDVHDLLHHVVTVCKEDVQSKKIDLSLKLDASRHFVKADSARLQQVLWNILRNAVKFSPREARVDVATSNEPDGRIRITMSDQGIGMAQETIQKLFKPFEQGGDEITRRFGGLGLGLAISKALVDVQGGTIEARSEGLGKGSSFTIILPSMTPAEAVATTPAKPVVDEKDARTLRILLAEDHVDTARILKLVMSNWGHTVETAGTVNMAVQLAKENHFDLLISDIGLPDGTGLDLIREVRTFSKVPAIALTGYGMDEDVTATREAGFNAHITKPTDLHQLQVSIGKLVDTQTNDSLQA